jgi:hypothetical protein
MADDILVSIHGKRMGLTKAGELVIDGKQVTNVGQAEGAKNGSTVVQEEAHGAFHKVKLTCASLPITLADDAGNGQYGGPKVYDFPEGYIFMCGAVIDGDLTLTEAAWLDTFDGDVALGTATADDGQGQDGATVALMATNALAQAVAQVASVQAVGAPASQLIDGTTTPVDMFLNFEIDDNAAHTAGGGFFTGTIEFVYCVIGDND